MNESKHFKLITRFSLLSILVPLAVAVTSGSGGVATKKMQQYLNIADSTLNDTSSLKLTEVKSDAKAKPADTTQVVTDDAMAKEKADAAASKLAESKSAETKAADVAPAAPTPTATVSPAVKPNASAKVASDYVVKDGDTYGCIAEKYYGGFGQYSDVMNTNSASTVPGYAEYHLDVGAKIQLPAVSADNLSPATSLCK